MQIGNRNTTNIILFILLILEKGTMNFSWVNLHMHMPTLHATTEGFSNYPIH